jgi:outer membrane protein assembly factor BamB
MSGLSAVDLVDGELRLRFYTKLDPLAAPNTERINASPAVWDGVAVVPMDNGAVYGLDAVKTGKVLWTFETREANRSSPAIAAKSGLVYFGSRDGKLYALDAKTGDKAWEFATAGPVDSSPWPGDGTIYVGSDDGHLYALH